MSQMQGDTSPLSGLFMPVRQKPGAKTPVRAVEAWDVMKSSSKQRQLPVPVLRSDQAAAVAVAERWMPACGGFLLEGLKHLRSSRDQVED